MKVLGATCPVCQCSIVLGPWHAGPMNPQDEAVFENHLKQHTLPEWVETVQTLRAAVVQCDELRRTPYWAMPRA